MPSLLKPGLYTSPPSDPEGTPRLHQSLASVLIGQSPLHCWYKAFGPKEEPSAALEMGQLCHSLLLGGDEIVAIDAPDFRTKAAATARDEARAAGKIPVLKEKLVEAEKLKTFIGEELTRRGVNLCGQNEVTAIWTSRGGTECQGRLDHFILETATIYDFKMTSQSAAPDAIGKHMVNFGEDIQCAAYTQAIETIYPELAGRVKFVFIYVETDPPNAITLATPAGDMRALGEWKWDRACRIWRECLEKYGIKTPWPGYATDLQDIHPPSWALRAEVEQEQIRQLQGE